MIQESDFTIVETPQTSPHAAYSSEPKRTSVLLVDDDDLYRDALHMHLAEEGMDVASFGGGRAGLDHLDAGNSADVILLDWRMPGLEGPELARRVRAHSDAPGRYTYIIFLTVLADPTHMRQAMEAGADQHLGKPYELEQLEAALVAVERVVTLHQRAAEAAKLQGALLAARTAAHHVSNQLSLTVGYAEMLARHPGLDADARALAEEALGGAEDAAGTLRRLLAVERLEEAPLPTGLGTEPILDLDRSTAPAP